MTSPMFELPEHWPIAVNAAGQGPANMGEVDHIACWCGDPECKKYLTDSV